MHKIMKKVLLMAAVLCLSLMSAFPALALGAVTEIVDDTDYVNSGPGAEQAPEEEPAQAQEVSLGMFTVKPPGPARAPPQGVSLGMFTVTGYCGCDRCSSGNNLTYSGTVPTPNPTISADLTHYPIGTKLRIGDVVYTVEDKGSSVKGNVVDIFYASHEEALAKGTYKAEVFLVQE